MQYVYILETTDSRKKYYIGSTNDLRRRMIEHNSGKNKSTKYGIPWKLIYYEAYRTEQLAWEREKILKQRGKVWQSLRKRLSEEIVPRKVLGEECGS